MKQIIRKTVLTLTAFMSVNSAFANTLTPTPETVKNGVTATQTKNKDKKIANTLPPSYDGKAMANTLPPSYEGKAMVNTLPPSYEGRAIANSLPPTYEGKALANSLPPTFDGRAVCKQAIKFNILDSQRVRMG